jgi:hypothetical protein
MRNTKAGARRRWGLGVLVVLSGAAFALPSTALAATNTISTVAGGGRLSVKCNDDYTECHRDFGDGGPATSAFVKLPYSVDATPDGGYVFSELNWNRLRRVSPNGTITTIAGTTLNGFSGDGGPATSAKLNMPMGVAVERDGGVLIADSNNHRIRRVSPTGTITTVAGTGAEGFSGDGGPATAARMGYPDSVSATADGGFLISDYEFNRVRRVSPTGTITTVAGSGGLGEGGFSGDGGPATQARFDTISDAVETPDGGVLISDGGNERIRRVSPTGMVTTVAGSVGYPGGFSGDGGLATLAALRGPSGLAVTASGGVLIADTSNDRVRFVDADFRTPTGS